MLFFSVNFGKNRRGLEAKAPSKPISISATDLNGLLRIEWLRRQNEITGDGSAKLPDDGPIKNHIHYHNGDEAILRAKRDPSSIASQEITVT